MPNIDHRDLLAFVPQLARDAEPGLMVDGFLLRAQLLGCWPACGWRLPAGQLSIACLRVGMAEAVYTVDAREGRLRFETVQLILVGHLGRDKAAFASGCLGLIQQDPLRLIADRDVAFLTPFGPCELERQHIASFSLA